MLPLPLLLLLPLLQLSGYGDRSALAWSGSSRSVASASLSSRIRCGTIPQPPSATALPLSTGGSDSNPPGAIAKSSSGSGNSNNRGQQSAKKKNNRNYNRNRNRNQRNNSNSNSNKRRQTQNHPRKRNSRRASSSSFSKPQTVSELVRTVRAVMQTKNPGGRGTDWRTARSLLQREARIPQSAIPIRGDQTTTDDDKHDNDHATVLPIRVYHELMVCMEREPRCWKDVAALARYMETGGGDERSGEDSAPSEEDETLATTEVDRYNSRPWYIPSPNYEIYHSVIACCCKNGGGRRDAHDTSLVWLTKMLRTLEGDLAAEAVEASSSSSSAAATERKGITNRDRKLVRNAIQLVLGSLSKQRKWREALQLLDYSELLAERAGLPLTIVQYNTVLTCLARSKQAGQCRRLLQRLQTQPEDSVPAEMKRRKTIVPDEISYNAAISACAAAGKSREALEVLEECVKDENVSPNIYIYTNAIRACAKGGNTQTALDLLGEVRKKGLEVDSYCYTAVMDACTKGKQWKKTLELFDEMEEKGLEPSQVTYSVTISALGNGLQWERALQLLNLMREKGMKANLITYNAAITALAKASKNQSNSAKQLSSSSRDTRPQVGAGAGAESPGDHSKEKTTTTQELWPKALALLRQMDEDGIDPDGFCYSSAINCCGAEGRWEEACRLIETMKKGGPRSRPNKVAYTAAISACGRAGQASKALELFQNMRDDGLAADRVAYNALFSALRVSEDPDKAYELWGEICGTRSSETSTTTAATSIASAGHTASPDIITLTDCIATLSRAGYTEKMDEVFREAVEQGIVLGKTNQYSSSSSNSNSKSNVLGNNDLDRQWEIDLSGLPFPIARAATRYLLQQTIPEAHHGEEDLQDMVFITGIGKAQQRRREESSRDATIARTTPATKFGNNNNNSNSNNNNVLERKDRTTSLRDFIQGILETDFDPPLESVVPHRAQGTVVIERETLDRWRNEQKGTILTTTTTTTTS